MSQCPICDTDEVPEYVYGDSDHIVLRCRTCGWLNHVYLEPLAAHLEEEMIRGIKNFYPNILEHYEIRMPNKERKPFHFEATITPGEKAWRNLEYGMIGAKVRPGKPRQDDWERTVPQ